METKRFFSPKADCSLTIRFGKQVKTVINEL